MFFDVDVLEVSFVAVFEEFMLVEFVVVDVFVFVAVVVDVDDLVLEVDDADDETEVVADDLFVLLDLVVDELTEVEFA